MDLQKSGAIKNDNNKENQVNKDTHQDKDESNN